MMRYNPKNKLPKAIELKSIGRLMVLMKGHLISIIMAMIKNRIAVANIIFLISFFMLFLSCVQYK